MIYLKINLKKIKPAEIEYIAGSLKEGQVLVLPTDTIYGLSCLASDKKAIAKIYKIKGRDAKKPLITLVSSMAMAKKYVDIPRVRLLDVKNIWENKSCPTTIILNSRGTLPLEITSESGGLSMRLPKLDFLIKIISKLKEPIVSTSLNLSGGELIEDLSKLDLHFKNKKAQPFLVVEANKQKNKKPSRLIDLRTDTIIILRK